MSGEGWHLTLRTARERRGMNRADLARLTSTSPETLRAYEAGRRKPSREALDVILSVLNLDRTEGNRIRLALGFAPDLRDYGTPGVDDQFTVEELQTELERLPWPAFAANELMEVVAANRAAQRLFGVDLSQEFLETPTRNLLRQASNPRFADHCLNWEEAVGVMVSMWKGHHRGVESLDRPSPYFHGLIQDFLAGDPRYVRRFLDLWERTPARKPKVRVHYRVVWRDDDVGEMRLLGIQSPANMWEALGWHDWIPSDADSWERLTRLVS